MRVEGRARVIADELARARARTDALLAPLTPDQLTRQVSPLMSPLVWDFAHIGHFEELWIGSRRSVPSERRTSVRLDWPIIETARRINRAEELPHRVQRGAVFIDEGKPNPDLVGRVGNPAARDGKPQRDRCGATALRRPSPRG